MNGKIIYKCLVGSQAYGTNTPTSDEDYKSVYIQDPFDILTFKYEPFIEINKDDTIYEVRRFIELLQVANPTMLELLYSPDDCIIHKTPEIDLIIENRDNFLTKKCAQSFAGYAIEQIRKAKGLNKKMNWEKEKIIRKTPIDFCYAYINGKTMRFSAFLKKNNLLQENCGLVALNHFENGYAVYYDEHNKYGYKGVILENSNDLRLSSIPKGENAITNIYYNKDGYSMHCKDYKEYQNWLKNRNINRYVDVKGHQQQIDGKNLLHCRRLLDISIEIATEKTIKVRRPNKDYLLSIRKGDVDLKSIIEKAEEDIKRLKPLYDKSDLPDDCDKDFCNELLLQIRKYKY